MTINLQKPDITELKPRITVFGVGGGGGNAVNNMINAGLEGVDFVVANTDAQALSMNKSERLIQMGVAVTEGLGAGSQPEVGRAAAEECIDEIMDHLNGTHMCFVTAGMGGGTGTGAAPVVAEAARSKGILTVGVVTKPFHFEGQRRMKVADSGISELQKSVDTLIVIPNQNLFRIANDKTTFADAFGMADQVLYSGVACITDLMVKEGLINLDFADVRSVMREMGRAMMGTGEANGDGRAMAAAEAAIANPLLDETSMKGAQGLLISITGGRDLTLFEVDEAATRIREEVDPEANIILGATFDEELEGLIRVSVVATGIDRNAEAYDQRCAEPQQSGRPSASAARAPLHDEAVPLRAQHSDMARQAGHVAADRPAAVSDQAGRADPVSVEDDIERELQLVAAAAVSVKVEAPGGAVSDDFQPSSRLFAAPSGTNAAPARPAPAAVPGEDDQSPPATNGQGEMVRMPRVEDFPPVVQAEMQHRTQAIGGLAGHDERGPMGLLKRISHSLGRREEEGDQSVQAALEGAAGVPVPAAQAPVRRASTGHDGGAAGAARPAPMPQPAQATTAHRRPLTPEASIYAPRQATLDEAGRARPVAPRRQSEEEQLDIPAFLRRQSN